MRSTQLIWALLLVFILTAGASATVFVGQTFSGQTFIAPGANVTLNVSGLNFTADRLETANLSVSLQNVSYNTTGANFSLPLLNFTTANSSRFSYQFPNITSSSGNTITILNGLAENVSNITITVGTNGIVPSSPRLTLPDASSQNPSYSYDSTTGMLSFTVSSLPSGVSTLRWTPVPLNSYATTAEYCQGIVGNVLLGFDRFSGQLALLGTIFGALLLLAVFLIGKDGGSFDAVATFGFVMTFAAVVMLLVVTAIMLGGLCV